MKEFLLLFRVDHDKIPYNSPSDMEALSIKWQGWIEDLSANNKLVAPGKRMQKTGKVVSSTGVTDGPFTEVKEIISGSCVIRGESYDDAVISAKSCPALLSGGSVEIRELMG